MSDNPRNLIVLSDGTGNSASNPFKTNVWRLYQAIHLIDGSQIAVFGDGVGTSSNKILRVIGLALGFGVKRNVLDLYKFLCRNYNEGDRIWAFGFSRGAFTIRVLVGLIHYEGLVSFNSEAELNRNALAAYRSYRKRSFHTIIPWIVAGRFLRDQLQSLWNALTGARSYNTIKTETAALERNSIDVHFVGVWDTVVAYGLPIDELTLAVDKWVWPMKFRDDGLLPHVKNARHALSLDDERRTFHPIPWDEKHEADLVSKGKVPAGRLLQVWFAGMHADVGGGYPDDGLSYVPLCWMINEAAGKGLRFETAVVAQDKSLAASTGRMYDSRAGTGVLWRYQPRNVQLLMQEGVTPLVHNSVVTRMIWGDDGYAPISLPANIRILPAHGAPLSFDVAAVKDSLDEADATSEPESRDERLVLAERRRSLQDAFRLVTLANRQSERVDLFTLVQDIVWWRRTVYFITLAFVVTAVAYPLLAQYLRVEGVTDHLNDISEGPVGWSIGLMKSFLPAFAEPWLTAVIRNSAGAALIGVGLIASLGLSKILQRRICDRARAAWNVRSKIDGIKLDRLAPTGQRQALAKATLVFATAATGTHVLTGPPYLFYFFSAMATGTGLWWAWRRYRTAKGTDPESPNAALLVARKLRTSRIAVNLYRFVARQLAPAAFLAASAIAAVSVVHRFTFDLLSATGTYCTATETVKEASRNYVQAKKQGYEPREKAAEARQTEILGPAEEFQLNSLCQATRIRLVAGRQYRLRLEIESDPDKEWFEKDRHADVAGFASDDWLHFLASPLKRWWRENWFQPIARIGEVGNNEHVLRPVAPLSILRPNDECSSADSKRNGAWDADIKSPAPVEFRRAQIECDAKQETARILVSDITADATGELFLYVNDAVVTWPGRTDLFYRNNTGKAKVTVKRILATSIESP